MSNGKIVVLPAQSEKMPMGDYYFLNNRTNNNRGPCGIPRNIFGATPYTPIGTHNFCRSDPVYCSDCPMNPNRTNIHGSIQERR